MKKPLFKPRYPAEALGKVLQGAGSYVQLKTQAPEAMCFTLVLAAGVIASQGLVKVSLRGGAPIPPGQFFVGEALSGERKSAIEEIVFKEHRAFADQQRRLLKAERASSEARVRAWKMKSKALQRKLDRLLAADEDTSDIEDDILDHERNKPSPPRRAVILVKNMTPQALVKHLAEIYPIVTVHSAEGGSASRTLGDTPMLNEIWDAGNWDSARGGEEATCIRGAVLSVNLMFQPSQLKKYLDSSALALENGNVFRWLFYRPDTTQGTRFTRLVELPDAAIEDFHSLIRRLLEEYAHGDLPEPVELKLSPIAEQVLSKFQDLLEAELVPDGWFANMKGAAGKAADIAGRISASLHHLRAHPGLEIGADTLRDAIKIVTWHLNEQRLRFCPYSEDELDAIVLREWLEDHVPSLMRKTGQYGYDGPALSRIVHNRLRGDVERLKSALRALEEEDGCVKVFGGAARSWSVSFPAWCPPPAPTRAPECGRSTNPTWDKRWGGNVSPTPAEASPANDRDYMLWPGVALP